MNRPVCEHCGVQLAMRWANSGFFARSWYAHCDCQDFDCQGTKNMQACTPGPTWIIVDGKANAWYYIRRLGFSCLGKVRTDSEGYHTDIASDELDKLNNVVNLINKETQICM